MRRSNPGKSPPAQPTSLSGKLAPAVGMLLLGDTAFAGISPDDSVSIPEPATLGLLAIGAAAGGAAAYVRSRRGKK